MNLALLETAAKALGALTEDVVFVGAATLASWLTDPAVAQPRLTIDVDVVVELATRPELHRFEDRLRECGFEHDAESGLTCRWRHVSLGLTLDVMPTDEQVLGFAGAWQTASFPQAESFQLNSGAVIYRATAPYLLAMKLEAFADRGNGDYLGAKDFADIITLVDGRSELIAEVKSANLDLQTYISTELSRHRSETHEERGRRFLAGLYGALPPDAASQQRVELVILPRIDELIGLHE